MAFVRRICVLTGFAVAATFTGALSAQASESILVINAFETDANAADQRLTTDDLSAASLENVSFANQTLAVVTPVTEQPVSEIAHGDVTDRTDAIAVADDTTTEIEADTDVAATPIADGFVRDEAVSTSAAALLPGDQTLAVIAPTTAAGDTVGNPPVIAQATAPLYRGIAPAYLGVGGNIGIIDSNRSAVGDFAFSVFGKVSLGPRFAVRPALMISEDRTSVTIPVTFNFNPLQIQGITVAPFIGGGVDISNSTGALVNAGVDIPISQQFTMTAQGNFRVTDDTGLGLLLGVAYNIPLFFE